MDNIPCFNDHTSKNEGRDHILPASKLKFNTNHTNIYSAPSSISIFSIASSSPPNISTHRILDFFHNINFNRNQKNLAYVGWVLMYWLIHGCVLCFHWLDTNDDGMPQSNEIAQVTHVQCVHWYLWLTFLDNFIFTKKWKFFEVVGGEAHGKERC